MAIETSLILVKPDGVQRGLVGEIVARIERAGLQLSAMKLMRVTPEKAQEHYGEHQGKPFFNDLVNYITSSPVLAMAISGPGAIAKMRSLIGATNPQEAAPGTIRADMGVEIGYNLVHGSANSEDAARELKVFFSQEEILDYPRNINNWISSAY